MRAFILGFRAHQDDELVAMPSPGESDLKENKLKDLAKLSMSENMQIDSLPPNSHKEQKVFCAVSWQMSA
jgi:hypothetical protein